MTTAHSIAIIILIMLPLQDWQTHKADCKANDTPPEIPTLDAILFAANETEPRMVKIPFKLETIPPLYDGDPPEQFQRLIHRPWPRSTKPFYMNTMHPPDGTPLPDGRYLLAYINDNFCNDGSPENRCIRNVTNGQSAHPWADHVFVVRAQGLPDETKHSAVMEEDLPVLVSYWREYGLL